MRSVLRSAIARRAAALCVLAVATTLSACNADRLVAPAPAPSPEFNASQTKVSDALAKLKDLMASPPSITMTGLQWEQALQAPVSRSFVVTFKKGGKLEIKELGFKIDVPKGAILTDSLRVTVTALEGRAVAYSFEPHGTLFVLPVSIEQGLNSTSWKNNKGKGLFNVGYFAHDWQVNSLSGNALINDVLPAWLDQDKLYFDVFHFSGYMVSMD